MTASPPPHHAPKTRIEQEQWRVSEKPSLDGLEAKWSESWENSGTYAFDANASREQVFSIDTPPPTVSGSLHIGHACSYTHTDVIARQKRMAGRAVFYPMGWDNNGLNVERRVQIDYGVICDPTLPYDPAFQIPEKAPKRPIPASRKNFIECCERLTVDLQDKYRDLWTKLGLSVDWSRNYTTMSAQTRRASQMAFLQLVHDNNAYQSQAPTLWDVTMQTAVAQAELQDRDMPGAYHRLRFHGVGIGDIDIDTTRPELLASCVALVVHPDDKRFAEQVGKTVCTPLFGVEVPVVTHALANPDKGTGAAMICTFGDITDVIWQRELDLPVRTSLGRDGRMLQEAPDGVDQEGPWTKLIGQTAANAQKIIVDLLRDSGEMIGEPKPITHPVKFWENGTKPLEIVSSPQWFIRLPPKDVMLEMGRALAWRPAFMRQRYEDWVNGLHGDWNITRQRYFSVPIPVWYHADENGAPDRERPIYPSLDQLPVDPLADAAPGFDEAQRNTPHGFVGDMDVMDTWATSSLTPQLVCGWERDNDLFARTFPMDMRPQAHEIIRTWLFYTTVRSHYLHGELPWKNAVISGFVVDPDRKKLSKSAGNAPDDPNELVKKYGADGVRYWAACGRLGMDITFDEGQMKVGRRLATKLLNATKFVLGLSGEEGEVSCAVDRSQLAKLANVVQSATTAFEDFAYDQALARTEHAFWEFCDDFIELVKIRAYSSTPEGASARATLRSCIETFTQLLAPFLPYAAEESWSWWHSGSVHVSHWPAATNTGDANTDAIDFASQVLSEMRKQKSEAKVSMKTAIAKLVIHLPGETAPLFSATKDDLLAAGSVEIVETVDSEQLSISVTL